MLRVVIQIADAGMAVNIGGPVETAVRTVDIDAPELEKVLRRTLGTYEMQHVTGIEVLNSHTYAALRGGKEKNNADVS